MQLVPERCLSLHEPLRDLLLPGRDESLLPDLDYAIGMEPDTPPTQTVRNANRTRYICLVLYLLLCEVCNVSHTDTHTTIAYKHYVPLLR